jgi:transposase
MFDLSERTRVFLKTGATDGRLGLDALRGPVSQVLRQDAPTGSIFACCNRRRNRIRYLLFDGSGFWPPSKRLERATFQWPKDEVVVTQTSLAQLRLLLEEVVTRAPGDLI